MAAELSSQQADSDEKFLRESLGAALAVLSQLTEADREAVRDIFTTLTRGMEFDNGHPPCAATTSPHSSCN
jgi:farnesyl-diphosphate farnesyltransferase